MGFNRSFCIRIFGMVIQTYIIAYWHYRSKDIYRGTLKCQNGLKKTDQAEQLRHFVPGKLNK